jgi:hypothetical protein
MTTTENSRADALTEDREALLGEAERIAAHLYKTGHYLAARVMRILAASPVEQPIPAPLSWLEWAVERWEEEVKNRPLTNVHRRTLDDTWRQVIRNCGGDDVSLLGPRHDDLIAPAAAPIEYRYEGGTHWCDLGPAEHMRPDFKGVYRLKAGTFPVWASDPAPSLADERAAPCNTVSHPGDRVSMTITQYAELQRASALLDWLEHQIRQRGLQGISFDWVPSVDGEPSGYRYMRRHFITEQKRTLRDAIDEAQRSEK